ncbi:MAG: hypothetical protein N4A72_03670 [Bacteroidales bacterium]|jgi:hypothetical protein|nr:hypothetical protein [Bacteroidales bacterium]
MIKRLLYLLIVIFTFISCSDQTSDEDIAIKLKKYVVVWQTRGCIDTMKQQVLSKQITDSTFTIRYKQFIERDSSWFTSGSRFRIDSIGASVPNIDGNIDYRLLDKKRVRIKDTAYIVYKNICDNAATDNNHIVFFTEKYGELVIYVYPWGNHVRLVDYGNRSDNENIFYLCEVILRDCDFFNS